MSVITAPILSMLLNNMAINIYGDRLALLAQLEITYADGTTDRVVTDETWRGATGPIRASDIYDGETYDARLERSGWSRGDYDDGDWAGVRPIDHDLATLVAPTGPPVRRGVASSRAPEASSTTERTHLQLPSCKRMRSLASSSQTSCGCWPGVRLAAGRRRRAG